MWRSIMSSRFASWVIGKISIPKPRQQQQELDMQRLYVVTQMYKAASQGKTTNMQQLIFESNSLEPSAVRRQVEAVLAQQVTSVAVALHEELTQAGDPALPAARMEAAAQRLRDRQAAAPGIARLVRSLTRTPSVRQPTTNLTAASAGTTALGGTRGGSGGGGDGEGLAAVTAGTNDGGDGGGVLMSAAQVAAALQRQIGFSLELRPSSVPHPQAGLGVFVRGSVRPGTVVAIFPGVLYGRTQLPLMPNYPKVDTENPYLSCRYDQSIMDSKPWGRGDPGGQLQPTSHNTLDASQPTTPSSSTPAEGSGTASTATTSTTSSTTSSAATAATTATSKDGNDSSSVAPWWRWCGPLSSGLQHLEGRHPLALGHFVNHPGQGQNPNVLEVSVDLSLKSMPMPTTTTTAPPPLWLRAYLPVVQPPLRYNPLRTSEDLDEDDEADDKDDESKKENDKKKEKAKVQKASDLHVNASAAATATSAAATPTQSAAELRLREVLSPPEGVVRLLVLVATRGIKDGEELLQNYRMSPHVVRPDWYVVHDAEAEERRWARASMGGFGNRPNATARTNNNNSTAS